LVQRAFRGNDAAADLIGMYRTPSRENCHIWHIKSWWRPAKVEALLAVPEDLRQSDARAFDISPLIGQGQQRLIYLLLIAWTILGKSHVDAEPESSMLHGRAIVTMRIYWRRLTAKSWILSRWYYRLHRLELAGRPSDTIWYFAYGSNMNDSTFRDRRRMQPLDWRPGCVKGYRLRFNLDGRPKGKAAPANICADPSAEVWGVLYKITGRDMLRLNFSEGVPGPRYWPIWLLAEDGEGQPINAMTYVAAGHEKDGRPSLRYISLLREGARSHGLPETWVQRLDSIEPAE
jgi:cation transport regulator ChaC